MTPKFFRPRSMPYALKNKVGEELDRLEKYGIIEKMTTSDWLHP